MNRQHAAYLLSHYFRLIAEAAGIPLTTDSIAEIETIAEAIYEDAVTEAKRQIGLSLADHNRV